MYPATQFVQNYEINVQRQTTELAQQVILKSPLPLEIAATRDTIRGRWVSILDRNVSDDDSILLATAEEVSVFEYSANCLEQVFDSIIDWEGEGEGLIEAIGNGCHINHSYRIQQHLVIEVLDEIRVVGRHVFATHSIECEEHANGDKADVLLLYIERFIPHSKSKIFMLPIITVSHIMDKEEAECLLRVLKRRDAAAKWLEQYDFSVMSIDEWVDSCDLHSYTIYLTPKSRYWPPPWA